MTRRAPATFTRPPDARDIEEMAHIVLAALPPEFRVQLDGLLIRVDEFCDAETERDFELESPFELSGIYRGVDLTRQSVLDVRTGPDVIELFRRPILDEWCETGEDLFAIVRNVLIHEIGHHFGLSDADIKRLEASVS